MKNIKLFMFATVTALLLVACNPTATKPEETLEQTVEETESVDDRSNETTEETDVETEPESVEETAEETTQETSGVEQGPIIKVTEDGKSDTDSKVIEEINTTKSSDELLNNEMTTKMQESLKDYAVTLVAAKNTTVDNFPKENLQAIAKYENDESFGWVVRYGVNKIALAQYYKESTTQVVVMFDSKGILEADKDPVVNDSPQEYKEIAQKIFEKQLINEDAYEFAY